MRQIRKARLLGAIRLVRHVDTIGIPIFTDVAGNRIFTPETDGDLRIREFSDFYNEHSFHIDYSLPKPLLTTYEIDYSVPIPFWIDNKPQIILGDADKEEPLKLFGKRARTNGVLKDISRLLDDARSGRLKDRFDQWEAETISNSFSDVFHEHPVRSRYWVSRYRAAVLHARRKTKPPHPVDVYLRNVATDWVKRFGSKTDLRRLVGMLGTPSNEILSRRQICDIIFAFLVGKLHTREINDIEVYFEEKTLHSVLPQGLYGYYIDHGWPRVPFQYRQKDIFISRALDELHEARERYSFKRARKMIFLLFGRAKLPTQLEAVAYAAAQDVVGSIRHFNREFNEVPYALKLEYAAEVLQGCEELPEIDGIIEPEERTKTKFNDKRAGVSKERLKMLRELVEDEQRLR